MGFCGILVLGTLLAQVGFANPARIWELEFKQGAAPAKTVAVKAGDYLRLKVRHQQVSTLVAEGGGAVPVNVGFSAQVVPPTRQSLELDAQSSTYQFAATQPGATDEKYAWIHSGVFYYKVGTAGRGKQTIELFANEDRARRAVGKLEVEFE